MCYWPDQKLEHREEGTIEQVFGLATTACLPAGSLQTHTAAAECKGSGC